MKKTTTFILLVVSISFVTEAQNHLKFMNVPIGGNINTFINSLKQKGFRLDYSGSHSDLNNVAYEDWASLSGAFWEFDWVDVLVQAPYADGGVSFVQVCGNGTRSNRTQFNKLLSSLDRKYGKHKSESNSKFAGDMLYIWNLTSGTVKLWRSQFSSEDAHCNVEITYQDKTRVGRSNNRKRSHGNDL